MLGLVTVSFPVFELLGREALALGVDFSVGCLNPIESATVFLGAIVSVALTTNNGLSTMQLKVAVVLSTFLNGTDDVVPALMMIGPCGFGDRQWPRSGQT